MVQPDSVVVDRLVAGSPVDSTLEERRQAVAVLTAAGLSARVIAGRLRTTDRQVVRYRRALRLSA